MFLTQKLFHLIFSPLQNALLWLLHGASQVFRKGILQQESFLLGHHFHVRIEVLILDIQLVRFFSSVSTEKVVVAALIQGLLKLWDSRIGCIAALALLSPKSSSGTKKIKRSESHSVDTNS